MYLIFVAAEAVPFAKKGGVADIVGCLPRELEYAGHRVQIILPLHQKIARDGLQPQKINLSVSLGGKEEAFSLWKGTLPDSEIPIYFVENPHYFDREEIYGFYKDNDERYAFFSLAVLETIQALKIPCQVLHLHDWPTALIPIYLEKKYRNFSHFRNISTLLTLHNLIYQGLFPKDHLTRLDLPTESFHWQEIEFYGQINFLKTGLIFADRISTVSPTHALDIQSELYGYQLEGIFQTRKDDLVGIVNGVDYSIWNPISDPYIPYNYTDTDLSGKKFCKYHLQKKLGLDRSDRPLLAMISRLDRFKGIDLVIKILPDLLKTHQLQFVLLGEGEASFIQLLQKIRDDFPTQFAVHFSYNNELAHLLEAG
ncbi:MAG: glycogen/starch synthase, partial [Planctomycetota bacterium]